MIKVVINVREAQSGGNPNIRVIYFNDVSINLKFDSVAGTFKLKMYFDPLNEDHAEIAGVSHMHICKIYYVHEIAEMRAVGESDKIDQNTPRDTFRVIKWQDNTTMFGVTTDELILTGLVLSQFFVDTPSRNWVEIGGYSKCGVIGDSDFSTRIGPSESIGLTFRQIVEQKIMPVFNTGIAGFKFKVKSSRADEVFKDTTVNSTNGVPANIRALIRSIQDNTEEVIEKTSTGQSTNILSYLKNIAVPKNIILSHDIFGNLIVNAPYVGDNFLFKIGTGTDDIVSEIIEMSVNYNGQGLHSYVEVQGQSPKDSNGNFAYAIIDNPLVPIISKPRIVDMTSGTDNDASKMAINEIGSELKSIVLKIVLKNPILNGKFITPNNTILVKNKRCYLYTPSKWFIEEVNYTKSTTEERFELTCVLPGVYGGKLVNVFVPPGKNLPNIYS